VAAKAAHLPVTPPLKAVPVGLFPYKKVKKNPLPFLHNLKSEEANKLPVYLLQAYDPRRKKIVYVYPFRTYLTLRNLLKTLEKEGLWPLVSPNPVYVPEEFWKEYRRLAYKEPELTVKLVRKYELLKDKAMHVFKIITIDIDSPFEDVYPVWKELLSLLELQKGYRVFKTKSDRFRAYISLDGTRDFLRAKELTTIIYAYFEKKGLNADATFQRLNHPVFWEDFPLYNYELVEDTEGVNDFYELYRRVKRLQKELGLYTFKGKNLTEEFWGKKPPAKRKECKIIKAPAFMRKLEMERLDVWELWEKAVTTLFRKHSSYRYIHVIQPAIGWAKYLGLPEDEVTEFLVELLGEEKRKDIEKAWKYAKPLEFEVPETITWRGRTREEWEREAIAYLKARGGKALRQELIKDIFCGQEWLTDLIMRGMVEKGIVEWRKYWEKRGKGRKPYVFSLKAESEALPKAVGAEGYEPPPQECEQKTQFTNSSLQGRAMGGRLERRGISGNVGNTGKSGQESVKLYGKSQGFKGGSFERNVKREGERRGKERVPNLTAAAKNEKRGVELPPELRKLVQEAEQAQKERNLQRLAELFKGACWYEVELPELMELYRKNRELCRLVERVLLLSGRRIDDMVRRVSRVLLLPCQVSFLRDYLSLRELSPVGPSSELPLSRSELLRPYGRSFW